MKHVPKHRAPSKRPTLGDLVPDSLEKLPVSPRKAVGTTLLLSTMAVAATGTTVAAGVAGGGPADVAEAVDHSATGVTTAGSDADTPAEESGVLSGSLDATADLLAAAPVVPREPTLSRSADRRDRTDPLKATALSADAAGEVEAGVQDLADSDPRDIARALLSEFGFSADQFGCLDSLYMRESGWNPTADNPTSSAYGIPQALPGSKMSSAGADWATNPVTQIRWGLGYIRDRYGSPCGAWGHSESVGWY
ncbi:lytic transglycosylase domain-containing protein [Nocardioides litoris]|uniref:aggregation-promoting factor C-terminal-like domain-containing protein n=1 Tax=Nocardioides litoris TaxID=1926648 RepID=UPI001FE690AA|nr:lytic transglycosylase domain-containing protein [Nocardioides litoris]